MKTKSIRPRVVTSAEIRRIARRNMAWDVGFWCLAVVFAASALYGGALGVSAVVRRFPRATASIVLVLMGVGVLFALIVTIVDTWYGLKRWREDCLRRARWTAEGN